MKGLEEQDGHPGLGGSIYNAGGSLELSGCRFVGNATTGGQGGDSYTNLTVAGRAEGGAIYSIGGSLSATNCAFSGNRCDGGQAGRYQGGTYSGSGGAAAGGAIYSTNTALSLVDVRFTGNSANGGHLYPARIAGGGGAAYGGAVVVSGPAARIVKCRFERNQGVASTRVRSVRDGGNAYGGALFHGDGMVTIEGTLFVENTAIAGPGAGRDSAVSGSANGGAVFSKAGTLIVNGSSLISNAAIGGWADAYPPRFVLAGDAFGGGVCSLGELQVSNCTVAGNAARGGEARTEIFTAAGSGLGGGIFNRGNASLVNVTLASNSVQVGTGRTPPGAQALGSSIATTNGLISLRNTIVVCSLSQTNVSGQITDGGHNISSDNSAGFTSPSSRNSVDPLLGTLGQHGGPTPTVTLLPGSPAIDTGDDSACLATDQRGVTRPIGPACDIGAYEFSPKLTLSQGTDGRVRLEYVFYAGETHQVQASTNLVDWRLLGTGISDANGRFEFEDEGAAEYPHRFYEVVPQR